MPLVFGSAHVAVSVRLGHPQVLPPDVVTRIVSERVAGRTLQSIADSLMADAVPTARGGASWPVIGGGRAQVSGRCSLSGSPGHSTSAGDSGADVLLRSSLSVRPSLTSQPEAYAVTVRTFSGAG